MVLVLELHDDRPRRLLISVTDLVEPGVEVEIADHSAFQRDVAHLVHAGHLHHAVLFVVAVAVFRHSDFHADAADLLKAGLRAISHPVAEIDEEVELHIGTLPLLGHRSLLVHTLRSAVHWPMRKITNSAGRNAATPMRHTRRPLSRSFWDIVERSHFTKYAFSGLSPSRAPLGSNTAHCVPRSMERSR